MQLVRDIEAEFQMLKEGDEGETGRKGNETNRVIKNGLGVGVWAARDSHLSNGQARLQSLS